MPGAVLTQVLIFGTGLLAYCYSASFYNDGFSIKTPYNCSLHWCGERWKKNCVLRYGYTSVEQLVYKTQSVVEQSEDCANAENSLSCNPDSVTTTSVQIPTVVHTWNRTTAEMKIMPPELSLGLIKTDNIDEWGNVISPLYPLNQDKIWQISVPQPRCSLVIYFYEFDIEHSSNCTKDYFSAQTSKAQNNIPRYCNALSRIEIRRTKRVQLWIHSDNSVSNKGIYAVYCLNNWPSSMRDLPCNCSPQTRSSQTNSVNRELRESSPKMIDATRAKHIKQLVDMFKNHRDTSAVQWNDLLEQHITSKFLQAVSWSV